MKDGPEGGAVLGQHPPDSGAPSPMIAQHVLSDHSSPSMEIDLATPPPNSSIPNLVGGSKVDNITDNNCKTVNGTIKPTTESTQHSTLIEIPTTIPSDQNKTTIPLGSDIVSTPKCSSNPLEDGVATAATPQLQPDNDHPASVEGRITTTPALQECQPPPPRNGVSESASMIVTLQPHDIPGQRRKRKRKDFVPVPQSTLEDMFRPTDFERYFVISGGPMDDFSLYDNVADIIGEFEMYSLEESKRMIVVSTAEQSHKLRNLLDDLPGPYTGKADEFLNLCIGTIILPFEFELADLPFTESGPRILNHLQRKDRTVQRVDAYTIRRGDRTPLRIVKIYFKRHELPTTIKLAGRELRVRPYVDRPRQCSNCWKFGHSTSRCEALRPRCISCGSEDHIGTHCREEDRRCANCDGNHMANSQFCPHYDFQKEILHLRATKRYSFKKAAAQLKREGKAPPYRKYDRPTVPQSPTNVRNQTDNTTRVTSPTRDPPRTPNDNAFRTQNLTSPALSLTNRFEGFNQASHDVEDMDFWRADDVTNTTLSLDSTNSDSSTSDKSSTRKRRKSTKRRSGTSASPSTVNCGSSSKRHTDWTIPHHEKNCGCHQCGRLLLLRCKNDPPAEREREIRRFINRPAPDNDSNSHSPPCYCATHMCPPDASARNIVDAFLKDNDLVDTDLTRVSVSDVCLEIHALPKDVDTAKPTNMQDYSGDLSQSTPVDSLGDGIINASSPQQEPGSERDTAGEEIITPTPNVTITTTLDEHSRDPTDFQAAYAPHSRYKTRLHQNTKPYTKDQPSTKIKSHATARAFKYRGDSDPRVNITSKLGLPGEDTLTDTGSVTSPTTGTTSESQVSHSRVHSPSPMDHPASCGCLACFRDFVGRHDTSSDSNLLAHVQEFTDTRQTLPPDPTTSTISGDTSFLDNLRLKIKQSPTLVPGLIRQFSKITNVQHNPAVTTDTTTFTQNPSTSSNTNIHDSVTDSQTSESLDDPCPQSTDDGV